MSDIGRIIKGSVFESLGSGDKQIYVNFNNNILRSVSRMSITKRTVPDPGGTVTGFEDNLNVVIIRTTKGDLVVEHTGSSVEWETFFE